MASKKGNYLTKKVKFQGKDMTMYSLDGVTWSTRAEELQTIIDRHSTEQAAFTSDLKGEEREKTAAPKPQKKFSKVHNDDEIDEVIEDDMEPDLEEELDDLPDDLVDGDLVGDIDEEPKKKGKPDGKALKAKVVPKKQPPVPGKPAKAAPAAVKKDKKAMKIPPKKVSKPASKAKPGKAKKAGKPAKGKK